MKKNSGKYNVYLKILKDELQVALGCTEPIALAYCASLVVKNLGEVPEKCTVKVCGNIIKNAKSVLVPCTDGLKGIECSVAAGFYSSSESKLQLLSSVAEKDIPKIEQLAKSGKITVVKADNEKPLYIEIIGQKDKSQCRVIIENSHTDVTLIEKDGKILFSKDVEEITKDYLREYSMLSVAEIVEFTNSVEIEDIKEIIQRQIDYNGAISNEGLRGNYGAQVGKVLLSMGSDVVTRAQAVAAAASDARMSGCSFPAVLVSGSGNQGITACLPIVEYAKELGATKEETLRAVVLSDLITLHQKTGIGKLSAFCGAVCAGIGAACGVAYLYGGDLDVISHTIVNALAITSGIVCDGAKPSCAGKIAASVYGGLLGYNMYKHGQEFMGGDGIITKGVDNTIANVSRLASKGMKETDREILDIMTETTEQTKS